ncbi:MAG: penicillin-binding protein activator [Pseudomonadota bacterium]
MPQVVPSTQIHVFRRLLSAALVCALLALAAGCESLPSGSSEAAAARAARLLKTQRFERAASEYLQLAGESSGSVRDLYLLGAAEGWIGLGDRARAAAAIGQVGNPNAESVRVAYILAQAGLANLAGNGGGALAALARADLSAVSLDTRIAAEAKRATALFLTDEPARAIRTLQQRELWLGSSAEVENNDQLVWEGLLQSDPTALRRDLRTNDDPTVSGWLALGLLIDRAGSGGMTRGVTAWQRRYPDHPAMRHVVAGFATTDEPNGTPQQIALLLTLSGRTAVIGQAVRDGFLMHYASRFVDDPQAPRVRVYDISAEGAISAYEQAKADGADLVIGPLLPRAAAELASYNLQRIPTVLLNYPAVETDSLFGNSEPAWLMFGLAPEDEAATVAARAYADGHRRAVAMVPLSDWGKRVFESFAQAFEALGGVVLTYEQYVASETDYSDEIERVMLLTDSVQRYRRMRSLLGGSLQFEPRRRADVDFIFMAANADSGRRMKPQFRFHYAGDLPVYATSHIHDVGRRQPDRDLNNIRFTDIPWLIERMRGRYTILDEASNLLVSARQQPRLFALGHDALDVGIRYFAGEELDYSGWPGATGELTIRGDSVHRKTLWAEFEDGRPVALPEAIPPSVPATLERTSLQ